MNVEGRICSIVSTDSNWARKVITSVFGNFKLDPAGTGIDVEESDPERPERETPLGEPSGPPVSSLAAGEVNLQQARIIANRSQRSNRLIINMGTRRDGREAQKENFAHYFPQNGYDALSAPCA